MAGRPPGRGLWLRAAELHSCNSHSAFPTEVPQHRENGGSGPTALAWGRITAASTCTLRACLRASPDPRTEPRPVSPARALWRKTSMTPSRRLSMHSTCWGLDSVGVLSSYRGAYLGDPVFDPLLQALDDRGAYLMLHSASPPQD